MKQNVSIIIEVYGFIDRRNFLIQPSGLTISVHRYPTNSNLETYLVDLGQYFNIRTYGPFFYKVMQVLYSRVCS